MTSPDGPRPPSRGAWIVILLLLVGLAAAAGVFWWARWARDPFRGALAISPEEFFNIKRNMLVKEVWLYESGELVAKLTNGFVRGDKVYARVWTGIPPGFLQSPEGLRELSDNVDPKKFHYTPRR